MITPNKTQKAVVTGATGQDGSYMVEYLLENTAIDVIIVMRRTSQAILGNIAGVLDNPRVRVATVDLNDGEGIRALIRSERPDYFFNFGAWAFVGDSWKNPTAYLQTNAIAIIHILEAVREYCPTCRVYSAGSSEQWGDVSYTPQDELHPMRPRSIYGVSKCTASLLCKVYRESYNMYVIHGLLLNHESERRQDFYLTRKVTKGVARIYKAISNHQTFDPIRLGNVYSKRDWSHAQDFIDGIWRMMNQEKYRNDLSFFDYYPDTQKGGYSKAAISHLHEYVLSSNETHTIKEFVEKAFVASGLGSGVWSGKGINETYSINGNTVVVIDPQFYRPNEVDLLLGNSNKARSELDWKPKVSFDELVSLMVRNDIHLSSF